MSLKFIKKAKGIVKTHYEGKVLYYTFKHLYMAISMNRSSIVHFYSNKDVPLYQINIDINQYISFIKEYELTKKISVKFEKELQKLLDDNFEILLKKLDDIYLIPIKQHERLLNEANQNIISLGSIMKRNSY